MRQIMAKLRASGQRPEWISEEHWQGIQEIWQKQKYKDMCA